MRLDIALRRAIRVFRQATPTEFVPVSDTQGVGGRTQAIPKTVFQTADSGLVHPSHAKSIAGFRELNPELSFSLFDKPARDAYMRRKWGSDPIHDVYTRSSFGQMQADIFRYCIIFERGGYYFDFNKGCSVPLTSLHSENATGIVSYESNPELLFPNPKVARVVANPFNLVLQWGFGFVPQHPFLRMVINRVTEIEPYFRDRVFKNPKAALLTMSAPGVFTETFRRYVETHGLSGIEEAGIDFDGHGIFRLRGSKKTTQTVTYYGTLSSQEIVKSPSE